MPRLVKNILDQVSTALSDEERVHWSRGELLTYFNEALREIAGLRPDTFVKRATLKLTTGAVQTLPAPYLDVVMVNGNMDENGNAKAQVLTKTQSTAGDRLGGKYSCASATSYDGVQSYEIVSASHGYFKVEPPVPKGVTARIDAMVYVPPPEFTEDQIGQKNCVVPCMYDAQIVDWIMKRAYEKDTESQWSRDRAAYHFSAFRLGMNADYRAALRLRSGYILGEKGTGVETTGWRNETRGVFDA